MQNAFHWTERDAFQACRAVLLIGALAGCGGDQHSPQRPSSATLGSAVQTGRPAAAPPVAPGTPTLTSTASNDSRKPTPAASSAVQARFASLPALASLSDREKAGLLARLAGAPASERLGIINSYPSLKSLSEPQQQGLLKQIETIVPISTPANLLVCTCGSEVRRELCVRESCSNTSELTSRCNQACGTLPAFGSACRPARQCGP